MAQILQPLLVLLLVFTLIFHPKGVRSLKYADCSSIMDIKNSMDQRTLKELWNKNYKDQVKNIDTELLKTRKRGRRAGVRVNLSRKTSRVPLPAVVLTNANSIKNKLDELHGLLKTKRLRNLSQIICITESWLTPDISKHRTNLDGYEQFRNDRVPEASGKSIGGGILMYIDKSWSTNNTILYNYTDCNLEMMTIKSRPHWLPREFSSIISISCYAPFTGNSRHKAATTSTINTIKSHVTQMELKYPDACFIIMGDFNQLPLN